MTSTLSRINLPEFWRNTLYKIQGDMAGPADSIGCRQADEAFKGKCNARARAWLNGVQPVRFDSAQTPAMLVITFEFCKHSERAWLTQTGAAWLKGGKWVDGQPTEGLALAATMIHGKAVRIAFHHDIDDDRNRAITLSPEQQAYVDRVKKSFGGPLQKKTAPEAPPVQAAPPASPASQKSNTSILPPSEARKTPDPSESPDYDWPF